MRIYTTRPGQRADVRLLDGSRVMLGVSSTLRVPEDYDESSRDLFVQGDAYFEVVHDPQKVFRVHARNTVAQDVGTKFAVRAYGGDPTVAIVVAEGSVSVKSQARVAALRGASASATPTVKGILLQSRDLLRVSPAGAMEVRRGVDVSYYLAWTEGRLEFRDAPLGSVATQLSRWYDIDMRLGDPAIASRRITMSLDTESVAEMLSLLEASLDLRVEQKGRTVTLYTP
jgi:ferric-dicitrate binding protein FerR (iron transport regulator)